MPPTAAPGLVRDTRAEQADRVAQLCERHPGLWFTLKQLDAACDLGSPSKVISAMRNELGYGVAKDERRITCADGKRYRRLRTYRVTERPRGEQTELPFPE